MMTRLSFSQYTVLGRVLLPPGYIRTRHCPADMLFAMDPQSLTRSLWAPLAPKLRPLLVSPHFDMELQFDGSTNTLGKPVLTIDCMECMRIGEGAASFFDDCGVYNKTRCNGQ